MELNLDSITISAQNEEDTIVNIFQCLKKKLPKAQRPRGLIGSYTNLDQISSSESRPSTNLKISTKHKHLDKTFNLKILTKPSFRISTKIELHNQNQASVAN